VRARVVARPQHQQCPYKRLEARPSLHHLPSPHRRSL
jgi:hypothetical protein